MSRAGLTPRTTLTLVVLACATHRGAMSMRASEKDSFDFMPFDCVEARTYEIAGALGSGLTRVARSP